MKQLFNSLIILTMATIISTNGQTQNLDFEKIKSFEHQLDDVMEIIDTNILIIKLKEVEVKYNELPSEIDKVRLGIIYHETALNLTFLAKSTYKGYAKKSFDILTELLQTPATTMELLPFIESYRASALSLVGGETMKLKLVGEAFNLFEETVKKYAEISYLPEFLRGSVAENLPWFFISKKKFAKIDMTSIIDKQATNKSYAPNKIMSFVYLAMANQKQGKKYKTEALTFVDKSIALDPNYLGARKKSEELKTKLNR